MTRASSEYFCKITVEKLVLYKRGKICIFLKLHEEQKKLYFCPRAIIEVNQHCPSVSCPGDNVDVVVTSDHAPVAKVEFKGQVLLVIHTRKSGRDSERERTRIYSLVE